MQPVSPGSATENPTESPLQQAPAHHETDQPDRWTVEITPASGWFHLPLQEIWAYRDLLWMLVVRDIVTVYKQTVLGPIWYLVQPLLTMLTFMLVFGNIAKISTDGLPQSLFYLSGIVIWNYFAETFTRTSTTFISSAEVFGKVYFPRLIVPLSMALSGLIKFLIQLALFIVILGGYLTTSDRIHPNVWLISVPYMVLLMAGLGLGFGILFSSVTTKYRDLNFVILFGVQLVMYATPIIYPMSMLSERLHNLLWWNPMSHIVEAFRYGFLGQGEVSASGLFYASLFTIITLLIGILVFHRAERDFIDTV